MTRLDDMQGLHYALVSGLTASPGAAMDVIGTSEIIERLCKLDVFRVHQ